MEFILCPNPNAEIPRILVTTKIGEGGITGTQFSQEIYALCELGKKEIVVFITSEGGNVFDGYAINCSILDVQEQYGVKITTLNGGIAASIAGCFSQAGSWRVMYDYSRLMLHNPFTEDGSEDKGLDSIRTSLITMISKRSGLPEPKVEELLADTSWINAEDAKALGLVDEVKSSEKIDEDIKVEILNRINYTATCFSNKINKKNKYTMNTEFIKVLNDAGVKVSDNASEDDVMNAMTALLKPMDEAKIEDKVITNDCSPMNDEVKVDDKYNDLKKAYDLVVDELTSMKKIISDRAEADMNDKIENTIKNAVSAGKIQASAVEMCKLMAKADFKTFEKFIEVSPVNKVLPTIEARDFKNENEKVQNETQIQNYINGTNGPIHGASLIQNATAKIMSDLENSYNPRLK